MNDKNQNKLIIEFKKKKNSSVFLSDGFLTGFKDIIIVYKHIIVEGTEIATIINCHQFSNKYQNSFPFAINIKCFNRTVYPLCHLHSCN